MAFKKVIAQTITKEGVSTKETDNAEVIASNIEKILAQRTKDATAEDIAQGKTIWVNGNKITGFTTEYLKVSAYSTYFVLGKCVKGDVVKISGSSYNKSNKIYKLLN